MYRRSPRRCFDFVLRKSLFALMTLCSSYQSLNNSTQDSTGTPRVFTASDWTIHEHASLPSTMDEARRIARPQVVIWAHTQTQGRGRRGRMWVSDVGNLYCSVVINPLVSAYRWGELSFVAAVTVGETLKNYLPLSPIPAATLGYKWPNDILIDDRKVAGILLETCTELQTTGPLIIMGIGVNIVSSPEQTTYPATCLGKAVASLLPPLDVILYDLLSTLTNTLSQWQREGFEPIRQRWLERASFLNQILSLNSKSHNQEAVVKGLFKGIDSSGKILLQTPNDGMKSFSTGDVFFDARPVDLKDKYDSDH